MPVSEGGDKGIELASFPVSTASFFFLHVGKKVAVFFFFPTCPKKLAVETGNEARLTWLASFIDRNISS